jgi:hypothetical protein
MTATIASEHLQFNEGFKSLPSALRFASGPVYAAE